MDQHDNFRNANTKQSPSALIGTSGSSKATTNKKILNLMILISFLFLSLLVYLTYFEMFHKDKVVANPYNRRQSIKEDNLIRGTVYDRNQTVLAYSKTEADVQDRIYPYKNLYSHVIGYSSKTYGKSQIEAQLNRQLLNISDFSAVFDIEGTFSGAPKKGNDVHLTIDHEIQTRARNLFGKNNGALVAVQPKTGAVIALVSVPDFDSCADSLQQNWGNLITSEESPLLPRATAGLYAPGSTFKIVTAAGAIEEGISEQTFEDSGSVTIDGKQISNYDKKNRGQVDIQQAFGYSSNVVFAQLGVQLGVKRLKNLASRIGLDKEMDFDIPTSTSRFMYNDMSQTDMAAVGIGQGKILVTPLHMAMITASVANGGFMMKPYIVDRVVSNSGLIVQKSNPYVLYDIFSYQASKQVTDMMQYVVQNGTGTNAQIKGIAVAGKTGTAENELSGAQRNKEHAWFVGFAPAENPTIAVAVILEYNGSTGGAAAAPIAREIMMMAINAEKK